MSRHWHSRPRRGRSPGGIARAIATAGVCAALVACAGVEVIAGTGGGGRGGTTIGTGGGTGGTGGGPSLNSAVVGRWTRVLFVYSDNGDAHESRTTWEFRQDGSALRSVTAWNLSQGIYDTVVSVATWSTTGSQLTITYVAPTAGAAAFAFSVNGDVLTIGLDQFARLR